MLNENRLANLNNEFLDNANNIDDCYIKKLTLSNYRNHTFYENSFPNGPIAIIGDNGMGKTNILEAISMLQPGRGFRSVSLAEMVNTDYDNFVINSRFKRRNCDYNLGTSFNKNFDKMRKVKLDGSFISPLTLTNFLGIISITPLMDKIFVESPSNRRKFIDKITWIFIKEHAANIRKYEKLISERNNLFKNKITDNKWFKSLEEQIVDLGIKIYCSRNKVINFLQEEMEVFDTGFPKAFIRLVGDLEQEFLQIESLENLKDKYLKILNDSRKEDSYKNKTSFGIHRSDLEVIYKINNMPAHLCSTGEQKSLLISIVLTVCKSFKKHIFCTPILLLDEVFAHLDISKKRCLSEEIERLKIQAFMTGIDETDFMTFNKKSCIINLNNR